MKTTDAELEERLEILRRPFDKEAQDLGKGTRDHYAKEVAARQLAAGLTALAAEYRFR